MPIYLLLSVLHWLSATYSSAEMEIRLTYFGDVELEDELIIMKHLKL